MATESPDTTKMTESPRRNSLEITLSLLIGLPFFPCGCSAQTSLTFSKTLQSHTGRAAVDVGGCVGSSEGRSKGGLF